MRIISFTVCVFVAAFCWKIAAGNPQMFHWTWAIIGTMIAGYGIRSLVSDD